MNCKNESQVIQRIIEEYERRLQEQLALARQDMANELEQQIQVRRVCVEETSLSHSPGQTNCNLRANLSLSLSACNMRVIHLTFPFHGLFLFCAARRARTKA